jgi:hypothetical protein
MSAPSRVVNQIARQDFVSERVDRLERGRFKMEIGLNVASFIYVLAITSLVERSQKTPSYAPFIDIPKVLTFVSKLTIVALGTAFSTTKVLSTSAPLLSKVKVPQALDKILITSISIANLVYNIFDEQNENLVFYNCMFTATALCFSYLKKPMINTATKTQFFTIFLFAQYFLFASLGKSFSRF